MQGNLQFVTYLTMVLEYISLYVKITWFQTRHRVCTKHHTGSNLGNYTPLKLFTTLAHWVLNLLKVVCPRILNVTRSFSFKLKAEFFIQWFSFKGYYQTWSRL